MTYGTPTFKDRILNCADCGNDFVWTGGEQRFYYSKGLSEPKRCSACRQFRKSTLPRASMDLDAAIDRVRSLYGDDANHGRD